MRGNSRCDCNRRTSCDPHYSYRGWVPQFYCCIPTGKLSRASDVDEYEVIGPIGWESEGAIWIIVAD